MKTEAAKQLQKRVRTLFWVGVGTIFVLILVTDWAKVLGL